MPSNRPSPPEFTIPMTAERLNWCLETIGWSRSVLAERLDIEGTTVARMCQGKSGIPNRVAVWIDTLAKIVLAVPVPHLWVRNSSIGKMRHNPGVKGIEAAWNERFPRVRDNTDRDDDAA